MFFFVYGPVRLCGVVKHHGVASFHLGKSGQPEVRQLNTVPVAWKICSRNAVVHQRNGNRGFRHAQSVAQLVHKEVVAHQHGLFHGRGRDVEGFKGNGAQGTRSHHRKQNIVHQGAHALFDQIVVPRAANQGLRVA